MDCTKPTSKKTCDNTPSVSQEPIIMMMYEPRRQTGSRKIVYSAMNIRHDSRIPLVLDFHGDNRSETNVSGLVSQSQFFPLLSDFSNDFTTTALGHTRRSGYANTDDKKPWSQLLLLAKQSTTPQKSEGLFGVPRITTVEGVVEQLEEDGQNLKQATSSSTPCSNVVQRISCRARGMPPEHHFEVNDMFEYPP